MRKYPITFALYGLHQDQRMRDVINREFIPHLEREAGLAFDVRIQSFPARTFEVAEYTPADLENAKTAHPYLVAPSEIRRDVPEDGRTAIAIFQREILPMDKNMHSQAMPWARIAQVYWVDGIFEDNQVNRIWLLCHELEHILAFQAGIPDVRGAQTGVHARIEKEWNVYLWLEQVLKPAIPNLPLIDFPDIPPPTPSVEDWLPKFLLDDRRITVPFGGSTPWQKVHLATDYAADFVPVYAPLDGICDKIYEGNEGGKWLEFTLSDGSKWRLAHLSDNRRIRLEQKFTKGSIVAISGSSGSWITKAHLHAECEINGLKVNPELYFNERFQRDCHAIRIYFGRDWWPAPLFWILGLVARGILGIIGINGAKVPYHRYAIGSGGKKYHNPDEYFSDVQTHEQSGIVGFIEAGSPAVRGLGITDPDANPA